MDNNTQVIRFLIEYIEEHITEEINLDRLAVATGYSQYHLHRMFSGIVGFPLHHYIKRRQLTEAAKSLIFTENQIIQIALDAGYESQQAFSLAFKNMYKLTPQKFRLKHQFHPIQLKFEVSGILTNLKGDRIMDIEMIEKEEITLVGFKANTKKGFFVIPRLWHKLHKEKSRIKNRVDLDYVVGINDYSNESILKEKYPTFEYYAAVEVSKPEEIASDMSVLTLAAGKYVVFIYHGKAKDSMQPVMDYIYKEWFPQSNCQLNDKARVDFIRYGEKTDEKGNNKIEVWVPIIS
ncbi:AraC family transcriptional regulator [Clostridium oryzae]|uniref:Right origin-binding protein n=1 Tax=Clostridium oryzae TaxID=1450648 RepID=A0A1V4IYC5_9CLOT|nr:AraC family transcriptional regulator [Clostridium oryzae]OPJ64785.1 right origin-binding protein [Clostridium oryzae]